MQIFDITKEKGLTSEQVSQRIQKYGFNELPSSKPKNIFQTILEIIKEPMFILLVICGILYLILGDFREALMLLSFVFVIMGITIYQERKTEKALDALKDLSSPRALVIRDGKEIRIAGREVVLDDIIILREGDRVPADAVILHSINLMANESLLTGESFSVRKLELQDDLEVLKDIQPGGDDLPFVYSGTMITQGHGFARIVATGIFTELGKIGKSLQTIEDEDTKLKKETEKLVKVLLVIGAVLCLATIILYWLTRGDFLKGFLAGITLAMAMLPEEFPVVLTIFMALGAWRISKKNVLTRKVSAIETLGSATVLCTDKTGTLTQNKMVVNKIFANGGFFDISAGTENKGTNEDLPESFHLLVEYGILASQKDPFDPMEKAILELGKYKLANTEHLHSDWNLIQQYSLSKDLLAMSIVWKSTDGSKYEIASKGAPEAIMDLCHLSDEKKQELLKIIEEMASVGLRILGVARANFQTCNPKILPEIQHDFDFEFLGFIGLADPIRPTVPSAIAECQKAGIKVVMITGDYSATARNIGSQIGLENLNCMTGKELDKLSDEELKNQIEKISIFARVVPEQKLRIVNAFKANGEIVAMTGDGVNDAPALKSSHIGIAMGGRGTDVARESSSLVLLDDDFSSIVAAVRLGRRIFDNLGKAMGYVLSIHLPIAGMALIPVIFAKLPIVFYPIHIVFLELIIDPTCSIIFEAEAEEKDVMNKPPRNSNESLFSTRKILISVMQGMSVLLIVLAVYFIAFYFGKSPDEVRALSFTTLIIANLGLILTNRSWTRTIPEMLKCKNNALIWIVIFIVVFLSLVLTVPFLRNSFHFSVLSFNDLLVCFAAGFVSILWFEVFKMIKKRM